MKNDAAGVEFEGMAPSFFLIGLINQFENRFQAVGDSFFQGISWKQVFALNCITLFREPPSIRELAELLGTSHQNTKQLLTKLERGGYVALTGDLSDRRKQRVTLTQKAEAFRADYEAPSAAFMAAVFQRVKAKDLETTIRVVTQLHSSLKRIQEELK